MFLSGLIFLVIGFFQFFFFPNLKPFIYLGWDMHQNRLFSTFFDPNFAGTFLVLVLIFVFILKDKIFPKDWKLMPALFLIFNFISIILTYSRGAYLMLLVSVATYSIITKSWKFLIGLVISFLLILILLFPRFDLESTNLLRLASIGARIESMKESVYIFQKQPFGVGFNTYRYARAQFGYFDSKGSMISHAGAGVDNSFLFVLVTTGFVGLILYLNLIYKLFKLGLTNMNKNKYALTLVVSLAGLVINALTINSLFYSFIMIWIFVLAGITESSLRE
jgi:O-antigen ligase